MGAKSRKKQEKQLKAVKKRLERERGGSRGRKPYALGLAIIGGLSLFMGGVGILNGEASIMTGMSLMMGAVSLFIAHNIYDTESKRMRTIEALERERNDLLDRDDA